LHLRELFAADPKARGEDDFGGRLACTWITRKIESPTKLSNSFFNWQPSPVSNNASTRCSKGKKSTSPKKRAVLHTALRAPKEAAILVDGQNIVPQVHEVLDRMADFSNRVRNGTWTGYTGKRIRNVHQHRHWWLGPWPGNGLRSAQALQRAQHGLSGFVSNVDGIDMVEATREP